MLIAGYVFLAFLRCFGFYAQAQFEGMSNVTLWYASKSVLKKCAVLGDGVVAGTAPFQFG